MGKYCCPLCGIEGGGGFCPNCHIRPDSVMEIAVTALGRVFQPGGGVGDYLVKRDGTAIGYGELAKMFGKAVEAELRERVRG